MISNIRANALNFALSGEEKFLSILAYELTPALC